MLKVPLCHNTKLLQQHKYHHLPNKVSHNSIFHFVVILYVVLWCGRQVLFYLSEAKQFNKNGCDGNHQLYQFTQMKRTDDPPFDKPILLSTNSGHTCNGGGSWCLTRMMDCRKPSGGWPDNVKDELMTPGMKLVQPCTADGYTRIDVQCGCYDCYC